MSDAEVLNRVGVPMNYGKGAKSNVLYCGRNLGKVAIPGSNGVCGPTNGPQCKDCQAGPVEFEIEEEDDSELVEQEPVGYNQAGVPMYFGSGQTGGTLYCNRKLGKAAIPGSNGVCGPNNGPQCADCKLGPVEFEEAGDDPNMLDGAWTVSYPNTDIADVEINVEDGTFNVGSSVYNISFQDGFPVFEWADGTVQSTDNEVSDETDEIQWTTDNEKYEMIVWTRA